MINLEPFYDYIELNPIGLENHQPLEINQHSFSLLQASTIDYALFSVCCNTSNKFSFTDKPVIRLFFCNIPHNPGIQAPLIIGQFINIFTKI